MSVRSAAKAKLDVPSIEEIVEDVAHLLPEQAPLHAFVHHNTLHSFEHLPFEEAVVEASKVLGTEPFMSEEAFAEHLASERILPRDINAVVDRLCPKDMKLIVPGGPTRGEFRKTRLRRLFPIPKGRALEFLLHEGPPLRHFQPYLDQPARAAMLEHASSEEEALRVLWESLENVSSRCSKQTKVGGRRRDELLKVGSEDADAVVHPLLIRLSAAFLDQGIAYWSMPARSEGFLVAVRRLYALAVPSPERALRGLAQELARQEELDWSAERTVRWALSELQVETSEWPAYIEESLLALRGWAGMMRHFELRPDRAPVEHQPARLMDFLAVRFVLDVVATRNLLRESLGAQADLRTLREHAGFVGQREASGREADARLELLYEAFILAQEFALSPRVLQNRESARAWLEEVRDFHEISRRHYLHLAYERRHRIEVLDGLTAHDKRRKPAPPMPTVQAAFCIDDREESLRRHLEECHPAVETFGYAGFYGVAMEYQGMEDIRPRPLCPVSIRPKHLVVEVAEDETMMRRYQKRRSKVGAIRHGMSVGSKTMMRGGVVSALFGSAALIPLMLRSLFPRIAQASEHAFEHTLASRPGTRLQIERNCNADAQDGQRLVGYTLEEMQEIVLGALRTMGMKQRFCPLVVIVGHGSSSLNNPHEAAHDCGATGGGRGGPNARAFAAMANHAWVRAGLRDKGLQIPDGTWFVGAYHNTCDDAMTYYDEDLVPTSHRDRLDAVKKAFAEACRLDAHERCRRFETAGLAMSTSRAAACARTHANDLAEPRPEYGHATNAVCIVGRRERTRGLFLDRRAFLVSYDPRQDRNGEILTALLLSVGPVGAGINLEYYFSFVDPVGYGSGTKLPHNITGLIGVMDGHATDLRTGLPWQMVEIHEPVRLLNIVEARPELLQKILDAQPALAQLVKNGWIQLVAWDPDSEAMYVFEDGGFRPHCVESDNISVVARSEDHYGGRREHLPPAHIEAAFGGTRP